MLIIGFESWCFLDEDAAASSTSHELLADKKSKKFKFLSPNISLLIDQVDFHEASVNSGR